MGTLIGFALGFYLGTKAGPNGTEELLKAWETIKGSEDFRALSATAMAAIEGLMQQGGGVAAKMFAGLMGAEESEAAPAHAEEAAGRNGNVEGLWSAISQSAEVQGLVSTGAALLMQLLEQGMSSARGRV
jgi:hypothetical protein